MGCTIKDIAKDTNLSLATISKYLNNKKISDENREKIRKSIDKLGYVPNIQAQTLRSKSTNTIAILLPEISDYFWGEVCNYVETYMRNNGYSTLIISYNDEIDNPEKICQQIISTHIAGVIILPQNKGTQPIAKVLKQHNIPTVSIDQRLPDIDIDSVTSNNYQSSFDVIQYFVRHCHKRIAVLSRDTGNTSIEERVHGIQDACKKLNISSHDFHIYNCDLTTNNMRDTIKKIFSAAEHPTAVFALTFDLTLLMIQHLDSLHLKIPYDFSLISFDDAEIFRAYNPPITVVEQNKRDISIHAGELLLQRLHGDFSHFPCNLEISTEFIERESVIAANKMM